MSTKFPKKPRHRLNVVATEKGWCVEKTGEVLVAYRGLADKIKEEFAESVTSVVAAQPLVQITDGEQTVQPVVSELVELVGDTNELDVQLDTLIESVVEGSNATETTIETPVDVKPEDVAKPQVEPKKRGPKPKPKDESATPAEPKKRGPKPKLKVVEDKASI